MVYILPKEGSPTVDCNKLCEKHFPTWRTMQVLLILVNSFSCDIPSMLQKWLSHVVSQGFWSILGQRKDLDKWPVHQRVNTHRHHLVSPILHLLGLWGTWTTQKTNKFHTERPPGSGTQTWTFLLWGDNATHINITHLLYCALIKIWIKYLKFDYFTQYLCMLNRVALQIDL